MCYDCIGDSVRWTICGVQQVAPTPCWQLFSLWFEFTVQQAKQLYGRAAHSVAALTLHRAVAL
jgi:hypothetical protein